MAGEWLIVGVAAAVGAAFLFGRHVGAMFAIRQFEHQAELKRMRDEFLDDDG